MPIRLLGENSSENIYSRENRDTETILREIQQSPEFQSLAQICEERSWLNCTRVLKDEDGNLPPQITNKGTMCVPSILAMAKIIQEGREKSGIVMDGRTEPQQMMDRVPSSFRTDSQGGFVDFTPDTFEAVGIRAKYFSDPKFSLQEYSNLVSYTENIDFSSDHPILQIMKALKAGLAVGIDPTRHETTGVSGGVGRHAMMVIGDQYANGEYGLVIFDPDEEDKGRLFYNVKDLLKWDWHKEAGIHPIGIPSGVIKQEKVDTHSVMESDSVLNLGADQELDLKSGALRVVPKSPKPERPVIKIGQPNERSKGPIKIKKPDDKPGLRIKIDGKNPTLRIKIK